MESTNDKTRSRPASGRPSLLGSTRDAARAKGHQDFAVSMLASLERDAGGPSATSARGAPGGRGRWALAAVLVLLLGGGGGYLWTQDG
ncbi:MAG TPA: hypothetical protein VF457_13280, partial [Burkholderiaceae bacterium]